MVLLVYFHRNWGTTVKRRGFIAGLGGAAVWPLAARALQQSAKPPIVGFLVAGTPASHGAWVAAFAQRLSELGWTDGRNIRIEYRWAAGDLLQTTKFVAE